MGNSKEKKEMPKEEEKMKITRRQLRQIIKEGLSKFACPQATKDSELNEENKASAAKARDIKYGHPDKVPELKQLKKEGKLCGNCSAFNITPEMVDCGGASRDGSAGYCEMHSFTCMAKKTCLTWASD